MSPRAFQTAALALLTLGIGLLVLQQQRIGELEKKLVSPAPSATVVLAPPPVAPPAPGAPRAFAPDPSGAPGAVVMSGLTKDEAFALAQRLQEPPPLLPAASLPLPTFLAQQRIDPALWKQVQAVNERSQADLQELARTFPSGSVAESEARIAKLESERKEAVKKLLNPEQMKAYEAMRATGDVVGVVVFSDGLVKRWVLKY